MELVALELAERAEGLVGLRRRAASADGHVVGDHGHDGLRDALGQLGELQLDDPAFRTELYQLLGHAVGDPRQHQRGLEDVDDVLEAH